MITDLVFIYGIIYKCTNLINGKIYIGQTIKKLSRRRIFHEVTALKNRGYYLHSAIRKYGKENFRWEIIESCSSKKLLDFKETFYIKFFNSMNSSFGYNLKSGGSNGNPYANKSENEMHEINVKKSKSFKGRVLTQEWKDKISLTRKSFTQQRFYC
jgi:group I intron endonuclease